MRVEFSKKFQKTLKKLPKNIQEKFDERFALFTENKFHLLLNNHSVHPIYIRARSINVTGDYRAIYFEEGGYDSFHRYWHT